jgi:hypothetical protein
VRANSDDFADAFVTADKRQFVRKWPVAKAGVQVGVADASAVHLEEALSWSEFLRLLHRMVVPDADGCIGGYDESGLLCSWDAMMRHWRRGKSLVEDDDKETLSGAFIRKRLLKVGPA